MARSKNSGLNTKEAVSQRDVSSNATEVDEEIGELLRTRPTAGLEQEEEQMPGQGRSQEEGRVDGDEAGRGGQWERRSE